MTSIVAQVMESIQAQAMAGSVAAREVERTLRVASASPSTIESAQLSVSGYEEILKEVYRYATTAPIFPEGKRSQASV